MVKTWGVVSIIAALLALTFGLWYNAPAQRQARVDAHLRDAILHNDTPGVLDALAQGANPNATYLFPSPNVRILTIWQRAKNTFRHTLPDPPWKLSPLALAILGKGNNPEVMPSENITLVKTLLGHGANPNCRVWYRGSHLLETSACSYKIATIDLLIRYGANVNAQDDDGNTALMVAAIRGHAAVATTLLEHGANVNLRNAFGTTPLMDAVTLINIAPQERVPLVRLLLHYHAAVSPRDKDGDTALTIARRHLPRHGTVSPVLVPIITLLQAAQARQKPAP